MIKSILLLDDDEATLELLPILLRDLVDANVVTTKYPTQALAYARKYCFDFVVIDVTINYNGTPFGGLEVYKLLRDRYGDDSLLLYSHYINDDLLRQYQYPFNFIEREVSPTGFARRLAGILQEFRKKQSCFIAMPFAAPFDGVHASIRQCVESSGYRSVRVDGEVFTDSIVQRVFDEIRQAKFIVFVTGGRNPNVFYEAGYAVALHKEVITLTDDYADLPFDIRDRSAIAYGGSAAELEQRLYERLNALTRVTNLVTPPR